MSKYLVVVDLPDDSRCKGCPFLDEERDWCFATEAPIDLIDWGNPMNWIRNLDCPLIPVDRVMGRMKSGIIKGSPSNEGEAAELAEHFLRDELGVTE